MISIISLTGTTVESEMDVFCASDDKHAVANKAEMKITLRSPVNLLTEEDFRDGCMEKDGLRCITVTHLFVVDIISLWAMQRYLCQLYQRYTLNGF
jgi:hypothetical protein